MTSLIFWGPYLAHKSIIGQKREKQRVKNYERWETLRDDYDEQRKIARESRSLDIQRTGPWDQSQQYTGQINHNDHDRGIFTLRDQQEANDARTGWRPQEAWDGPRPQRQAQMNGQVQQYQNQRHVSSTPAIPPQMMNTQSQAYYLNPQKTGATWDEGLPQPLQVSRRSFDDYDHSHRYRPGSISSSTNVSRQPSQTRRESAISRTHTPSGLRDSSNRQPSPPMEVINIVEQPKNEFGFVDSTYVRPLPASVAGGRMAELIERGY